MQPSGGGGAQRDRSGGRLPKAQEARIELAGGHRRSIGSHSGKARLRPESRWTATIRGAPPDRPGTLPQRPAGNRTRQIGRAIRRGASWSVILHGPPQT